MSRTDWKRKYKESEEALHLAWAYIENYGAVVGTCKSCGHLLHAGYVCGNCGRDPSFDEVPDHEN